MIHERTCRTGFGKRSEQQSRFGPSDPPVRRPLHRHFRLSFDFHQCRPLESHCAIRRGSITLRGFQLFFSLDSNVLCCCQNPHHYKDAQQIVKQCVSRSSTLAAAPPNLNRISVADIPRLTPLSHAAFPASEAKKELPGL